MWHTMARSRSTAASVDIAFLCGILLQEQDLMKPASERRGADARNRAATEKENRPSAGDGAADNEVGADNGAARAAADGEREGGPPLPAPESPFAAISASMGWNTFYLVRRPFFCLFLVSPRPILQHSASAWAGTSLIWCGHRLCQSRIRTLESMTLCCTIAC